ncbi:MAG TPA: phosphate ABC transporter permease PstA [Pseudonocardiaceae bacterium]|jgi:phosphate transport system permease protein
MSATTEHGRPPDAEQTTEITEPTQARPAVIGEHVAHDLPRDHDLIAGEEARPLGSMMAAATPESRRELRSVTLDDRLSLIGAAASALALDWLVYWRLLPFSGIVGFVVAWYALFLLLYAVVSGLRYGRTFVVNRLMSAVVHGAAFVVGGALLLVIVSTVWQGSAAFWHVNFFTSDLSHAGPLDPLTVGGALHALLGTLIEVAITIVITLPLGVLTAVYLNEIGGPFSRFVRSIVEAMTALPDVVAGLFVYIVLLITLGLPASGFAAAVALSITMMPITARAAEVVLRVVPGGLREASLALGASQWRTVWQVVLPTARSGLATALILGVARGIGETAPVLLTAGFTNFLNVNPFNGPMVSLPLFIYQSALLPEHTEVQRAFGAAMELLVLVVLLFVTARALAGRRSGGR